MTRITGWAIGFVWVLAATTALAADTPAAPQALAFRTMAQVEIDAQGGVSAVRIEPSLPPAVAQVMRDVVGKWRFSPPTRDGHAATGLTYVQLAACAVPADGNYRFAVAYNGHGPGQLGPPPRVPMSSMRENETVDMKVTYRVLSDGTGTIEDIAFVKGANSRNKRAIESALHDWMKAATFQPEQVDGQPVNTRMTKTVRFATGESMTFFSMSAARQHYAKEQRLATEKQPACQAAAGGQQDELRATALDSPFTLLPQG
jgi:hypothetical protein